MKTAILTQALHNNSGGYLQNYALQKVLESMGHDVETLDWDYYVSAIEPKKPFAYLWDIAKTVLSRTLLRRKTNYPWTRKEIYHLTAKLNRQFADEHMNVSEWLWGKGDFKRYSEEKGFDAFIVGSDQVWRAAYNKRGMLYRMFLDFTENMHVKRIVYAASFGTEEWEYSLKQTKKCSELIQHFDTVSVREASGIDLCKKHFGVNNVRQVLDPTMLLEKQQYLNLIKDKSSPQKEKYVLSYVLDNNKIIEQTIIDFCSSIGYSSFFFLPKPCNLYKQDQNDIQNCILPSVIDWLNAIAHSDFVVCDSFHGVVFSIIFNKPFAVLVNAQRGSSRFQSILSLFQLEDRIFSPGEDLNYVFSKQIDWKKVNRILAEQQELSLSFLTESLKQ